MTTWTCATCKVQYNNIGLFRKHQRESGHGTKKKKEGTLHGQKRVALETVNDDTLDDTLDAELRREERLYKLERLQKLRGSGVSNRGIELELLKMMREDGEARMQAERELFLRELGAIKNSGNSVEHMEIKTKLSLLENTTRQALEGLKETRKELMPVLRILIEPHIKKVMREQSRGPPQLVHYNDEEMRAVADALGKQEHEPVVKKKKELVKVVKVDS